MHAQAIERPIVPESAAGWYTVRQFCERNPCFTEASVRSYIFDAAAHGLEPAILKAGRKVLVHEQRWFDCFAQRGAKQ